MADNFQSGRTICLLNENAQCNPIWVSRGDGLQLAHFQTFHLAFQQNQQELTREEQLPVDPAAYAECARHCLPSGHN